MLKALGDETRFSMYRELATSTRGCSAQELADSLGLHANTVRLHLDRLREAGLVEVEAVHRGTVGRPDPRLLARARARPGLGLRPAELHAARRAARRARRAGRRRRRRSHRDRPGLGRRGRQAHPVALVREGARGRDEPPRIRARDRDRRAPPPTWRSCTARSGSWPRPTPSSCATSTAGSRRGSSTRSAAEALTEFATLYDRDPCRVAVSVR